MPMAAMPKSVIDSSERNGKWRLGEVLCSAFHAIDDADDLDDLAAELDDAIDRLQRAAAGGHDVVDDDHFHAGDNRAFDVLVRAVTFRFFADEEPTHLAPASRRCDEHSADDRVGSDRHAADRVELHIGQQVEQPFADQPQSLRVQRDLLAVEVVARFFAAGEREVAELEGAFVE